MLLVTGSSPSCEEVANKCPKNDASISWCCTHFGFPCPPLCISEILPMFCSFRLCRRVLVNPALLPPFPSPHRHLRRLPVSSVAKHDLPLLLSNHSQTYLLSPPPPPVPVPVSMPAVTKKPSRGKLSFGKSGGEAAISSRSDSQSSNSISNHGSARIEHVSNHIMGLNAPVSPPLQSPPSSVIGPPSRPRGEPQLLPQPRRALSPSTRSRRTV
jgi:hypothetical protein